MAGAGSEVYITQVNGFSRGASCPAVGESAVLEVGDGKRRKVPSQGWRLGWRCGMFGRLLCCLRYVLGTFA